MSAKLQHQQQHQHQYHQQQQHLKVDSNVASFGGSVTTTVSAAEGAGLRSVEKSAVLTERRLDGDSRGLHLAVSDASLTSSGTGDSASEGSSAASVVSSGVSTDSVELVERRQYQQQHQPVQQQQQQQQRFASLLTVERGGPPAWVSHAHVTFRFRSDRLYYLDSAGRLHGPMDQREQCQVASVRRHATRSGAQQPPVATRSHRAVPTVVVSAGGSGGGFEVDDGGLLLLERRLTSASSRGQRQSGGGGGGGAGAVYSRVQVNQYDDWSPLAPMPRSRSQQLEFDGVGGGGGGGERELRFVRRQHSRDGHSQQLQPQQQQQHYQYYQRSSSYQQQQKHHHHGHSRVPQPQHPGFDARLEHLERSLNHAMESIRRQTSSHSRQQQHHQHQQNQQHQQHHRYLEQQEQLTDSGGLRRFNSEPPFEFRYSQRTMTHETPQVTEEVETTTLQPIGRGIHDLGSGARVTVHQQQQQQLHQQFSATEHRVTRSGRLTVRQPAEASAAGGRSLSANRNATLRASTPVSPKLQRAPPAPARGRHLSAANAPREFAQVY